MQVISHRGLIEGEGEENSPYFIDAAINRGFYVEIDIRFIKGSFWLGHDTPDYRINLGWLERRKDFLLLHCKNIEAAQEIAGLTFHFFCHSNEPYVLTSRNLLWVHDISLSLDESCIIPLISKKDIENFDFSRKIRGICTDYPIYLDERFFS